MPKITLPTIESGYLSTEALNAAFDAIETALDNTVSRDGSTPNQMNADLDLNGYRIINTGAGEEDDALITRGEMEDYVNAAAEGIVVQKQEIQTATAAQTVFVLTEFEYEPGAHNLAVYVDGTRKFSPDAYTETNATTITFLAGQSAGAKVQFVSNEFLGNITLPTHTHPWSQITGAPIYTTRWPDWTEVTGKPSTFTPATHQHSTADITSGTGLADARRGVWVQAAQPTAGRVGELWFW